eukprot:NODE_457_length_1480_cov_74.625277_g425_i0.p1 GENE.NODE_457_length_1480_cov_74.625277_g425_i0~~NODE_457_length_1480_cov_74.625277_g425_i0.p1  ORF type:complete len:369 (-),score=53.04 NODE_457_length_1480_cov_74.625277_g425_i0:373-1386(-)
MDTPTLRPRPFAVFLHPKQTKPALFETFFDDKTLGDEDSQARQDLLGFLKSVSANRQAFVDAVSKNHQDTTTESEEALDTAFTNYVKVLRGFVSASQSEGAEKKPEGEPEKDKVTQDLEKDDKPSLGDVSKIGPFEWTDSDGSDSFPWQADVEFELNSVLLVHGLSFVYKSHRVARDAKRTEQEEQQKNCYRLLRKAAGVLDVLAARKDSFGDSGSKDLTDDFAEAMTHWVAAEGQTIALDRAEEGEGQTPDFMAGLSRDTSDKFGLAASRLSMLLNRSQTKTAKKTHQKPGSIVHVIVPPVQRAVLPGLGKVPLGLSLLCRHGNMWRGCRIASGRC